MGTCDMTISVAEGDRVLLSWMVLSQANVIFLSKPIIILGLILLNFNAQN